MVGCDGMVVGVGFGEVIESEKNVKIKPHATSFTILQGFGGVRGECGWRG